MPTEDENPEILEKFIHRSEVELLRCFPSQAQATKVMAVLYVLSNHSPDEEYLGEKCETFWEADPKIKAAFEKFSGRLKTIEGEIEESNSNWKLKNRTGAGVMPYELLKPFSEAGVTSKGIPYSISI